ncbi:MAG TPA: hypothetical protein VK092_01275 [Deinococcales bacterium]|nr:hypothetical protein [Deinococcales bacterium]
MAAPRLGADGAPPFIPVASLLLGALALTVGAAWLLLRPGVLLGPLNSAGLTALTHIFTLGFVGLIFAGTLQQLPAVMFVTKLAWPGLGWLSTPLLLAGTLLVVLGFGLGWRVPLLVAGGSLVSSAWVLLFVQLLFTALNRWPEDAGSHALIISVLFLTFTVMAGFLLAAARDSPAVVQAYGYPRMLHLTLGLFGAFLLGIAGSGQKLLSMFALSKGGGQWRIRLATLFITLGIAAEALQAFTGVNPGQLPVSLLAAGTLFHLLEVYTLHRGRLRKRLEPPVWRYVYGHAFLPVALVFLVAGQPAAAAAAFLVGFIGLAVSGMLVKITSFLIWTAVFAGKSGGVSKGAPLLRDLFWDPLEPVTTWGLAGGALALALTLSTGWAPLAVLSAVLLLAGSVSQLVQVSHVVAVALRAGQRIERGIAGEAT